MVSRPAPKAAPNLLELDEINPGAAKAPSARKLLELDELDLDFELEPHEPASLVTPAKVWAAEKAEQERIAREAAAKEKAEQERIAREAAEKAKAEQERIAREAAEKEKAEQERIAREAAEKEKAEQERIAREAAEKEKAEQERIAREAAEKEKAEQERIAREAAEKTPFLRDEDDDQPPVSSRQPRNDFRMDEDDAFAELGVEEEEEPPPASRKVASQRMPDVYPGPEELDWSEPAAPLRSEPAAAAPAAKPGVDVRIVVEVQPVSLGSFTPITIDLTADKVRRSPLVGEAAHFIDAVDTFRPESFGELLDASLALGEQSKPGRR